MTKHPGEVAFNPVLVGILAEANCLEWSIVYVAAEESSVSSPLAAAISTTVLDLSHLPNLALLRADLAHEGAPPRQTEPDVRIALRITAEFNAPPDSTPLVPDQPVDHLDYSNVFFFNNVSWVDAKAPLYYSKGNFGFDGKRETVHDIPFGSVVDLLVTTVHGTLIDHHPLHIHGHSVWVLAFGDVDDFPGLTVLKQNPAQPFFSFFFFCFSFVFFLRGGGCFLFSRVCDE